jgi:hypothetical protein
LPGPPSTVHRGLAERAAAWVITGPLGHLYSAVADLAVFFVRSVIGRARRRLGRRP